MLNKGYAEIEKNPPLKRLKRTLTTENVWLYILSLLSKKDKKKHGYIISSEISKKFGWEPGFITPYIVLYRLEKEGYIKSKNEGRRVVYEITKEGKKILYLAKKMLRDVSEKL